MWGSGNRAEGTLLTEDELCESRMLTGVDFQLRDASATPYPHLSGGRRRPRAVRHDRAPAV